MVPDRQKVWTDGMDGRTDDAKTISLRLCRGIINKLEHAVDGVPSQIPTLKFLTPQHPQVRPLRHDPGDRMKIPLDMFYIVNL